jgi:hypothetical protein
VLSQENSTLKLGDCLRNEKTKQNECIKIHPCRRGSECDTRRNGEFSEKEVSFWNMGVDVC